jgi:hypothetical protein
VNVNTEVKTKFNSLNVAVEKSKNVETVKTKNGKNEPKKRLSPPRRQPPFIAAPPVSA